MEQPGRIVTLVLVTPEGDLLGALDPFEVEVPWWPEAGPVVSAARERHGIDVTVLRMLDTERPAPHGGRVTYLAETRQPVDVRPWSGRLDDHPLRMPWARPGGPDRDLAWADAQLAANGTPRRDPAAQVRTWNLSSLWRLPTESGAFWLKVVPPFFAHEGPMLRRLAGGPVPRLLAEDGGRLLMPEIPGEDLYDPPVPRLHEMVGLIVGLQREWAGRTDELRAIGLPDWRAAALTDAIGSVIERTADELTAVDRATLDAFVSALDVRFTAMRECGIEDGLVHGDFHPGNLRGDATNLVLLDWGDCGVGHPLLDQAAFLDAVPPDAAAELRAHWSASWRDLVPASDPDRAARLLRPIAAARQAVIYRRFLDNIEPSEQPYHRADPATWLRRTAALARDD